MKAAFLAACLISGLLVGGVALAKPKAAPAQPDLDAKKSGLDTSEPAPEPARPVDVKLEEEGEAESEKPPTKAAAKEPPAPESKGGTEPADDRFGHAMQFGLRAALTGGYRVIFRYDKSPFCRAPDPLKVDKDQQKFCGGGAPLALDVALSFGVLDFIEPYVWGRFGLAGEAATNTNALTAFGVGARIYTMSDSKLKIFVDPGVGMELEGGGSNAAWKFFDGSKPEYKTDFLFHLGVGPQYDFARAFGVYLNAGITTGVLRYIHTQLELSGGVQVRMP